MRICLDARAPNTGGTRTFVNHFLEALAQIQTEHEFCLVLRSGDRPPNALIDGKIRCPTSSPIGELVWSQTALPSFLTRENVDLYHSLKHVGPLISGTRTIYHVAAIGQFAGAYPLPTSERLYWKYLFGAAIRRADLLITVSDHVREFVISEFQIDPERVVRVYNGRDEFYRPLTHEERRQHSRKFTGEVPLVLSVGNVVPVKNHETAIKACGLARKAEMPDWRYVVAGSLESPQAERLRTLASELGVEDQISFLGYLDKKDLRVLYNAADVLVHPSISEGFGLTLVEAMACGLPVIVSNWPASVEVAGEGGLVYGDPKDEEALARTIADLLGDRKLMENLSKNALARAEDFSWVKCVRETIRAYQKLY